MDVSRSFNDYRYVLSMGVSENEENIFSPSHGVFWIGKMMIIDCFFLQKKNDIDCVSGWFMYGLYVYVIETSWVFFNDATYVFFCICFCTSFIVYRALSLVII